MKPVLFLDKWKASGVRAGFTTKRFPLVLKKSEGWLDPSNQRRFETLFSKGRYAVLNQVHGARVAVLADPKRYGKEGFYHFPESDGVITDIPGLTLLVLTADCLPVFLCMDKKAVGKKPAAKWVGLVHAGWRGTHAGIVEKAVKLLCKRSGGSPRDIRASFGPCIGKAHYEVGEEFAGYFTAPTLRRRGKKLHFDLAGENRRRLLALGVLPGRISDSKLCTVSKNRDFYSFRREKEAAGRTISFITKL